MTKSIERTQTGVRLEKRLLKVLKGLAEHLDLSLGDLLEGMALHSFENRPPFSARTLEKTYHEIPHDLVDDIVLTDDASHDETVSIHGLDTIKPLQEVPCTITMADGSVKEITLKCRIDTAVEIEYIENGGVLHYVLRNLAREPMAAE